MPRIKRILPTPGALHIMPAYLSLSNNTETRKRQYREFIVDERLVNKNWFERLRYIGNDAFQRRMQEYFHIRNTNLKRGRPRKTEK
jgi:hypothetical protein